MNKYINVEKRNETEEKVRKYFENKGYKSLSKGWPDFVFFKFLPEEKIEAIFVEVKRSNQNSIKPHQNTIKKIFGRLGIEVKVCFGSNPDGSPNFREIEGRKIKEKYKWNCLECGKMNHIYNELPTEGSTIRCLFCRFWFSARDILPNILPNIK